MWWIPLAWLGGKAFGPLIQWDRKQPAQFRCHASRSAFLRVHLPSEQVNWLEHSLVQIMPPQPKILLFQ
jgi:hypothetical protein